MALRPADIATTQTTAPAGVAARALTLTTTAIITTTLAQWGRTGAG